MFAQTTAALNRRRALVLVLSLAAVSSLVGWDTTSGGAQDGHGGGAAQQPVPTTEADWAPVAERLGRPGKLLGGKVYRVVFPRTDLIVVSRGVVINPGLALTSSAAFARYADGQTMMMADLVVTEDEVQRVTDALQAHGIGQTALHKHLLAQLPDIWWTHLHAVGDAVRMAGGVRAALDETGTPPPTQPAPAPPGEPDLDTQAIDEALGTKGTSQGGIYRFVFARRDSIVLEDRVAPPARGVMNTALNFQATGGGRAAINGDFVMTANEVQAVIQALRSGGIDIVAVHNHALTETPRLFFLHFWANSDAVALARTLRKAIDATNVTPVG